MPIRQQTIDGQTSPHTVSELRWRSRVGDLDMEDQPPAAMIAAIFEAVAGQL